ncbi:hypothetical protein [Terracidiphilus sp.]|uniref:hypothetical protein n=1 Tax=Terracidiphilus sp. TaxID=1964191 RepID=UPI003C25F448
MNECETETAIYELRKKAAGFLRAGDVEGFNHLQDEISRIQKSSGVVIGTNSRGEHDAHTETN